eukprot:3788257-Heterocapsa_arctica.AAC.1
MSESGSTTSWLTNPCASTPQCPGPKTSSSHATSAVRTHQHGCRTRFELWSFAFAPDHLRTAPDDHCAFLWAEIFHCMKL